MFVNLLSVENIHELVNESLPETMQKQPAFKKNCDLIIIYKVDFLSDFNGIEEQVLEIEENPYYFKKYFFYYSDAEEKLLLGKSYEDFKSQIKKMDEFDEYKKDPLKPSFHSLVTRMFIKFPFLEIPKFSKSFQNLTDSVSEKVNANDLVKTYDLIRKYEANNIDEVLSELLNEELENIKASDSSI
ncbi:ABC-three component system middle component 1 [Acinetobacter sp. 263903-1]|uniref:ABC-three component system middle component 1 n=1 Tax=Acinetobacter TaxID=469 RepID=UPI002ADEE3CD|nr:ABC-three component system middle component 1 [Acinetobacter sp. 263903-1]